MLYTIGVLDTMWVSTCVQRALWGGVGGCFLCLQNRNNFLPHKSISNKKFFIESYRGQYMSGYLISLHLSVCAVCVLILRWFYFIHSKSFIIRSCPMQQKIMPFNSNNHCSQLILCTLNGSSISRDDHALCWVEMAPPPAPQLTQRYWPPLFPIS